MPIPEWYPESSTQTIRVQNIGDRIGGSVISPVEKLLQIIHVSKGWGLLYFEHVSMHLDHSGASVLNFTLDFP